MRFWSGLTVKQRILDGLCILLCVGMVIYDIFSYVNLPEIIPTNYNFAGEPTGYGNKNTIFILLGIDLVITASLCVMLRIPGFYRKMNIPWAVPWGCEALIVIATKDFICWCNLSITVTLVYLNYCIAGQQRPEIIIWIPSAILLILTVLFNLKLRRICKGK